jgi:hypothetical protein
MSEATVTVSQPKVVNICSRLAKAQACSATELKGHANALENLAKEFEIQYSLAVEARDEESIKVLQGQVAKDQGQIYESYYKLFRQAVGMGEPMPEPAKVEAQYQETALNLLDKAQSAMLLTLEKHTDQIADHASFFNAELKTAFDEIAKLNNKINFILENFTMKRGAKSKSI